MLGQSATDAKIVVRFAKGCALVVSLFSELMRDLKERHPSNKSFLLKRAMPVMRAIVDL
jgi:hypothetical protein